MPNLSQDTVAQIIATLVDALERYSARSVTASNGEYADMATANAVMDRETEVGDTLAEQCGLY
jgi:hypothetical protein